MHVYENYLSNFHRTEHKNTEKYLLLLSCCLLAKLSSSSDDAYLIR